MNRRLLLLGICLALTLVPLLRAQGPAPYAPPPGLTAFSFSTWNPWAVRYQPRLIPEPVRAKAPDFTLPRWALGSTGSNTLALRDLRGEIVVLDFWSRSCPPCVPLHEALMRMAPYWEGQGVRVLSILISENPAGLEQFFENHGGSPPFPVLIDTLGITLAAFDHTGLPSVVVLDHYGRIALELVSSKAISDLPRLFPTLISARSR